MKFACVDKKKGDEVMSPFLVLIENLGRDISSTLHTEIDDGGSFTVQGSKV